MKIKCPKCKEDAELTMDFSLVRCTSCDLDMTYGEYVKFVAHNETRYSDILWRLCWKYRRAIIRIVR